MPNKKELGKLFKKDAKTISDALEAMSECEQLGHTLEAAGEHCGSARLCGCSPSRADALVAP